jgi:hypothetical protein
VNLLEEIVIKDLFDGSLDYDKFRSKAFIETWSFVDL